MDHSFGSSSTTVSVVSAESAVSSSGDSSTSTSSSGQRLRRLLAKYPTAPAIAAVAAMARPPNTALLASVSLSGVSVSVGPSGGSVSVRLEAEHRCLDGRRLLVTHGDVYDELLRSTGTGAALAWGAVLLSLAGRGVDRVGGWFGWGRASLVDRVIRAYGGLVDNHRRFRRMALLDARVRGYDGVVCGHIHWPQVVEAGSVTYYNCGDWTTHCTALVEGADGGFRLVRAWAG